MTNKEKLDKLVAEIERLYNQSLVDENRQAELGLESAACTSYGKSKVCKELLSFIDSMQKEPESHKPKITLGEATGKLKELVDNVSEEELVEAHKQLEELTKECMYSKDNYTAEDRKVLCEGCEEECEFNKKEEPINEDLNKAAEECAETTYSETNSVLTWRILEDIVIKAFKAGANWQEKQDQETIELAEDHAMLAGMEKMKEEMMAKAIDGKVEADLDPHGADYGIQRLKCEYGQLEALKIKNESKVKVIVIKEE